MQFVIRPTYAVSRIHYSQTILENYTGKPPLRANKFTVNVREREYNYTFELDPQGQSRW